MAAALITSEHPRPVKNAIRVYPRESASREERLSACIRVGVSQIQTAFSGNSDQVGILI
jgi:hypothetical protein